MKLNIIPLGGGKEIGANSYYIEFENATFIIDAGSNPNKIGFESLPQFQHIKNKPDAIFISHAHFDHIGSLPVYSSIYEDVNIYMTKETFNISKKMLHNTIELLSRKVDEQHKYFFYNFYNHSLLNYMYSNFNFNTVKYNIEYKIPGTNVRFKFYNAGHILGSAGILFYTQRHKLFYTGDFKLSPQTLEKGANFNMKEVETLITEGTYAYSEDINYQKEVDKLIKYLNRILKHNGKALLPAFAVGRTQELINIINENMHILPENVKVYSLGLGNAINKIYRNYKIELNVIGERLFLDDIEQIDSPAIFIATNGMLVKSSYSFNIAQKFIKNKKNGIIFTGFLPDTSYGAALLNYEYNDKIPFFGYERLKTRHIYQVHLSAHAMHSELLDLINNLKPKSIIIIHSEKQKGTKLKKALKTKNFNVYFPSNGELLYFDNRSKIIKSANEEMAVITTVGISLITNYYKRYNKKPKNEKELLTFITEEKFGSSAEIESIYKLEKKYKNLKNKRLYLLFSDTKEGKISAYALRSYFLNIGYDVDTKRIKGLKPDAKYFKNSGLNNFINIIADIIEKHSKNAIINATGGFKAEISYATLIGILYKINVYYLFDDFKEIIDLPFLPINYDFKILDQFYTTINTLLTMVDYNQAEKIYISFPPEIKKFLFYNKKLKKYYLTPPGVAFMRAYKHYADIIKNK